MKYSLPIAIVLLMFCSCTPGSEDRSLESQPKIVCTTSMIADMADQLIGDSAEVIALMGPGVDPHLYKASQGDVSNLSRASVIVYNGLHLEGKMTGILEKMGKTGNVIRMSDGVPESELINSSDYPGAYDPHIWFDVSLWSKASIHLAEKLSQEFPQWEEVIAANSQKLSSDLEKLDQWCSEGISDIPQKQRVLITAHDAFKYFGERYGIEVRGLQGISTAAEYGLRDVSNLVSFITDNEIKAIFVESSVPKRAVESVVIGCRKRGHDLVIGGELFSDALGEEGTPEGTYEGMVRHNVNTIVNSLTSTK